MDYSFNSSHLPSAEAYSPRWPEPSMREALSCDCRKSQVLEEGMEGESLWCLGKLRMQMGYGRTVAASATAYGRHQKDKSGSLKS